MPLLFFLVFDLFPAFFLSPLYVISDSQIMLSSQSAVNSNTLAWRARRKTWAWKPRRVWVWARDDFSDLSSGDIFSLKENKEKIEWKKR